MSRQDNNLSRALITQFESEVFVAHEQEGSIFRGKVRERNVKAEKIQFQKLGNIKMQEVTGKTGNVPRANINHGTESFDMRDFKLPVPIDNLQAMKTNFDVRSEYTSVIVNSMNLKTDDLVIEALIGRGNGKIDAEQTLDFDSLSKIRKWFSDSQCPKKDKYVAVGSGAWNKLLSLTEFTSADFTQNKKLDNDAGMVTFMGMTFFECPRLNEFNHLMGDKSPILAWQKNSVGMGMVAEIKPEVVYNPQTMKDEVHCSLSGNAGIIDGAAVAAMTFKTS